MSSNTRGGCTTKVEPPAPFSYLYKENVPKNVWEHLNKYICDKNGNSLFNDKNPSSAATSEKKQQVKRNIIKCIQDHINHPLNKEEKEDIGDE